MSSKKYLPGPESYREFRETGPRNHNLRPGLATNEQKHGFQQLQFYSIVSCHQDCFHLHL